MAAIQLLLRKANRSVTLDLGEPITAGRAAQCELHIDDPSVSRRHCTFTLVEDGVRVQDLGSANGTFVNERRVTEATARAGDVVRLGASVLDVRDPSKITARTAAVQMLEQSHVESVIEKRIEPSSLEWLTSASMAAAAPDAALLQRAQRHLATLHRVSEMLAGGRDMARVTDATLRAILEVLAADRTAIVLRRDDPAAGGMEVLAARSRTETDQPFTISRTLVSDVIEKGISVFAHDASADERFASGDSIVGQHIRSVMCVPLRTTEAVLGAMYVDSLSGAGRFTEADLELLAAIGNQAGVAIHRVRLMGELERLLLDTIRAIAATIDARDGYTHRHSERVAALGGLLAQELGLPDDERERVELSGLLHDVGKIAVPDSILNKPGKLTPEEFAEMQKHPAHGARILGNIASPTIEAVIPGVRYHHEKWDGTGYPDRLTGEDIPLLGRMLGVADFYDALTSARTYRAAMDPAEAIALIEKGAGSHFDPRIAAAAVRLFERGELMVEILPSEIRSVSPASLD